ncbi:MAG: hypothetical protein J6O50_05225 [Ruminiclostridium sp.]|nr:hypothetical protein [Ruminiclostridium sp.]
MDSKELWSSTRDRLVSAVTALGYPEKLGNEIAKHIGAPKGMERMISYLDHVRPNKVEMVVDEMISIRSEIDAWRDRKASLKANAAYNEMLYYGSGEDED